MTDRTAAGKSVAALMLVSLAATLAHAAEPATVCNVFAWTTDDDPKGLNVRAGPGASYPVIATLPPPLQSEGYEFAPEVQIASSENGWFRIIKAVLDDYGTAGGEKVVFTGSGWVSGRLLGTSVEGRYLRDGPSPGARPVLDFYEKLDSGGGPDSFAVERLLACNGLWLQVEGTYLDKKVSGWTNDTCSNQVTTCP
ncbi:MAG: SH3 domain-containing protein [Rhizobiaceae bacterium]|nr:SH3 domain-containing protein [Rhizobiaceae bacterium]